MESLAVSNPEAFWAIVASLALLFAAFIFWLGVCIGWRTGHQDALMDIGLDDARASKSKRIKTKAYTGPDRRQGDEYKSRSQR